MHSYLWIKWKVRSSKLKSFNLLYGLGALTIFFFICTHDENSLKNFMMKFHSINPNIKFTYEFSEESINFLDLNVKLSNGKRQTTLYVNPTDQHQYIHCQ